MKVNLNHPNGPAKEHLLREILQDRPIAYHPLLAKRLGGAKVAIYLSQLLYWSDKGEEPDGYFYKTAKELWDETGLSEEEQRTARKRLVAQGILSVERASPANNHWYHVNYYRITWEALYEQLANTPEASNEPPAMKVEEPDMRRAEKPAIDGRESPPSSIGVPASLPYTETTHRLPIDYTPVLPPKLTTGPGVRGAGRT